MNKLISAVWPRLWLPIFFLAIMWLTEITEQVLQMSFSHWGVMPRDPQSLIGVLSSPFLHGDWGHIISNSLPFIVLSAIVFLVYQKVSYKVFIAIYVLTGLAVWTLARGGSYHIGASGLVYGLFGFVFFSGIFRGDIKSIGIALAVGFFYGGMVWGVIPTKPGISWESHLFGGILGAVLAYIFRNENRVAPPVWMEEEEPQRNFDDFIRKYADEESDPRQL